MVKSMTGFGKVNLQMNNKEISIEMKSLNSKYLDVNMRLPSCLKSKEIAIRKLIGSNLKRGKIDLLFSLNHLEDSHVMQLDKQKIQFYMNELSLLAAASESELLSIAVKFPDVLTTSEDLLNEEEWIAIENAISKAIEQIDLFRTDEGVSIQKDLEKSIENIRTYSIKMSELAPERIEQIKEKLKKKLEELQIEVDANRFEQELIYHLEKIDINEEEVRLLNHLNYFEDALRDGSDSNGKKLNFIAQEIGREINTLGSKSNHAIMQQYVVQMKEELEKIKEQTLNIL